MKVEGIAAEDVTVRFGGLTALSDVSFSAASGSVTGLVGPNGAGKSTLFNVVTGVIRPTRGSVRIGGQLVTGFPQHRIAQHGVARTFQTPRGFPSLSVLDNLLVASEDSSDRAVLSLLGRRTASNWRERALEVLSRVGLADRADESFTRLSAGEARLLEVGRHLMRDPDVVLLDEPTAGVAPELQDRLADILSTLRDEGRTLVCVEHNMKFLRGLADTVLVLESGKVIAEGTPEGVFSDERVIRAYLGDSHLGERGSTHA